MVQIVTNVEDLPRIKNLSILSTDQYLSVKSDDYGWFVDENFIMPFFIDKKLVFRRLVITHAPIKIDEAFNDVDGEKEQTFVDDIITYLDKNNTIADYIEKAQANVVFNKYPQKANVIPWGTYLVDINKDDEQLLASFHTKHRNVIRKAIKDGCIVEKSTIEIVQECITSTLTRQKVHAPSIDYYKKLKERIPENVEFYHVINDGKIDGVALVIYGKISGYYMYGGSAEHHHTGSVNLLQYEIMKDLRKKGVMQYDLVGARIIYEEGSKYEGIQRFKSRFSSKMLEGFSFNYILNPFKYKLFMLLVKTYGLFSGFKYTDTISQTLKLMRN